MAAGSVHRRKSAQAENSSALGIGQITLADRVWQLQQHFERWAVRFEPEQSAFERQDEPWLFLRLPFEPDGSVYGRFTVQERERDLFPFRGYATDKLTLLSM